jgi:hypothetical protein
MTSHVTGQQDMLVKHSAARKHATICANFAVMLLLQAQFDHMLISTCMALASCSKAHQQVLLTPLLLLLVPCNRCL